MALGPTLVLLGYGSHVHGHGGGHSAVGGQVFGELFRTMAHAAVWSVVGRLVWHLPIPAVGIAFALGAGYLVWSGLRRRGRRSSS